MLKWTLPKLMLISTSHTKGIFATAIVQCAAACKCLQSGTGLVDAFLTGLVDAWGKSSCRELQCTPGDVHPFTKARAKQINVAKSEAEQ